MPKFIVKKRSPVKHLKRPSPTKARPSPLKSGSQKENIPVITVSSTTQKFDQNTFVIEPAAQPEDVFDDSLEMCPVLQDLTNSNVVTTPFSLFAPNQISTEKRDVSNNTFDMLSISRLTYTNESPTSKDCTLLAEAENTLKRKSTAFNLCATPCKKPNVSVLRSSPVSVCKQASVFTSATTNPFINMSVLCSPVWVRQQERNFKNWLNSLLTAPQELDANPEVCSKFIISLCVFFLLVFRNQMSLVGHNFTGVRMTINFCNSFR